MKYFLTIALICITFSAEAQKTSVEKSLYGVQTGLLGIWGYKETKLSNSIALRSEVGFDSGIWGGSFYEKTGFVMAPVFTFEPRFYYNLDKRALNSKNTKNNSGNFLSLQTSFHPDWFVISNYDHVGIISNVSMIPTWGIRRQIGKHFNYEAGIGLGYRYLFSKNAGYAENESEAALNIDLRIGYTL